MEYMVRYISRVCPTCKKTKRIRVGNSLCSKCRLSASRENKGDMKANLPEGHRECRYCEKIKPDNDFYTGRVTECKDCTREKEREKYKKDPEKRKVTVDAWRKKNPDKILSASKKWRSRNKERIRVTTSLYRTRLAENGGVHTEKEVRKLLKLSENKCLCCGASGDVDALEIDHIVPVSKGGGGAISNLQPLCRTCNGMGGKGVQIIDYRPSHIRDQFP